jgi:hypothetical protein
LKWIKQYLPQIPGAFVAALDTTQTIHNSKKSQVTKRE